LWLIAYGVGVALLRRDASECIDAEPSAQVSAGFIQQEQVQPPGLMAHLSGTIAACVIDLDLGPGAGAMVIQKRIQMLPIETADTARFLDSAMTFLPIFPGRLCLFEEQFFRAARRPFC
jgi:hypothetical protein